MEWKLTARERAALETVERPVDAKQLKRVQGLLAVADGERPTAIARRLKKLTSTADILKSLKVLLSDS